MGHRLPPLPSVSQVVLKEQVKLGIEKVETRDWEGMTLSQLPAQGVVVEKAWSFKQLLSADGPPILERESPIAARNSSARAEAACGKSLEVHTRILAMSRTA